MEVVETVMVETMVEFTRGKSRTKTAADELAAAIETAQSTTAQMASSHRKTATGSTAPHMASSHRKTAATSTAATDKRNGTVMGSAESILKVRRNSRLSWPQHQWG
jgi:hypothetical protein